MEQFPSGGEKPVSRAQEILDALDRGEIIRGNKRPQGESFSVEGFDSVEITRGEAHSGEIRLSKAGTTSITVFGADGKAKETTLTGAEGETLSDRALTFQREKDAYRIFHRASKAA